jgi:hypothetical protein
MVAKWPFETEPVWSVHLQDLTRTKSTEPSERFRKWPYPSTILPREDRRQSRALLPHLNRNNRWSRILPAPQRFQPDCTARLNGIIGFVLSCRDVSHGALEACAYGDDVLKF